MARLNPYATFDSLFLASQLQSETGSFAIPEVHVFAYLGCILWLYDGNAVADWGYSFAGTELGAPFSPELDSAVKSLADRGYVLRVGTRFKIADLAESELRTLMTLETNGPRLTVLRAAWASTAALSVGIVGSAIAEEPDLKRARTVRLTRPLLEDAATRQLYGQFDTLRNGLGPHADDLRLPAVVWLSALHELTEVSP